MLFPSFVPILGFGSHLIALFAVPCEPTASIPTPINTNPIQTTPVQDVPQRLSRRLYQDDVTIDPLPITNTPTCNHPITDTNPLAMSQAPTNTNTNAQPPGDNENALDQQSTTSSGHIIGMPSSDLIKLLCSAISNRQEHRRTASDLELNEDGDIDLHHYCDADDDCSGTAEQPNDQDHKSPETIDIDLTGLAPNRFMQHAAVAHQSRHANVYDYIHHNYDDYSDDDGCGTGGFTTGSSGTIRSSHWTRRHRTTASVNASSATAAAAAAAAAGQSPYRTHSHFGFRSPRHNRRPQHFHSASNAATTQYVPLPRALSLSEVLASERVQLCDEAAVPQLLRCAIDQRPPLSLGALPEFAPPPMPPTPPPPPAPMAAGSIGVMCATTAVDVWPPMCVDSVDVANETCNATFGDASGGHSSDDNGSDVIPIVQTVIAEVHNIPAGVDDCSTEVDLPLPQPEPLVPEQLVPQNDKENVIQMNGNVPDEPLANASAAAATMAQCDDQPTFLRKIAAMHYSSESLDLEWQQKMTVFTETSAPAAVAMRREPLSDLTPATTATAMADAASAHSGDDRSQYDPMEQHILHRIDEFALDRVDPIFTTIRNHIIEYNSSKSSIEAIEAQQPQQQQQQQQHFSTDILTDYCPVYPSVPVGSMLMDRSSSSSHNVSQLSLTSQLSGQRQVAYDFDDEELFNGFSGRCSSTPKSVRSTTMTTGAATTLNTRRTSTRWAEQRSAATSLTNGNSSYTSPSTVTSAPPVSSPKPPAVNVSKRRSTEKRPAAAMQQQTRKKLGPPARNFIQENIAKAALKNTQLQLRSANASSKSRARIVVPPSSPQLNGPSRSIRTNVTSIFATYPASAPAEPATTLAPAEGNAGNNDNSGTGSEPCCSDSTSPSHDNHSNMSSSSNERRLESQVAAIQLEVGRLLETQTLDSSPPTTEVDDDDGCGVIAIAAEHAQLDGETNRLDACIAKCSERLTVIRLDGIAADLDEIEELHDELEVDRAAERLTRSELLSAEWERFNCLVHEVDSEED